MMKTVWTIIGSQAKGKIRFDVAIEVEGKRKIVEVFAKDEVRAKALAKMHGYTAISIAASA